jgi:subtilisin family serine protease
MLRPLRDVATAAAVAALGLTVAAPAASASAMPSHSASRLVSELRQAWTITKGRGVTVAVLSNGVDPDVTGLAGKVTVGPDYAKLRDPLHLDGTLIANGIAGDAVTADNPGGMLGLAPGARILSIRVEPEADEPGAENFDEHVFSPALVADGIRYAADHGAGVIYLDWMPASGDSVRLEAAVQYALAKGVVITTTAEQDEFGRSDLTYPAGLPGVIAATTVTLLAPFPMPPGAFDGTAANDSVLVSVPDNTLTEIGPGDREYSAWSFDSSAAWIAGTAALIKSAYPRLAPALVARAIALSASYHPVGGYNVKIGFGLINPYGALTEAGKLAKLSSTAGSVRLAAAAHFGPVPGVIDAAHRSKAAIAAIAAGIVAGVALLVTASLLPLRRRQRSHVAK